MIRVKDPVVSLRFYQEVLGMDLIYTQVEEEAKFTLYFLSYDQPGSAESLAERGEKRFSTQGVLELTHNHGTENDPDFAYSSGNQDPGKGFGHIAIGVENIEEACERFEKLGVTFRKRLTDGRMKDIAFILDPDGYWVEIVKAS
ncbi:Lactoylglutathione lyase [Tulasnella sp. 403]|nr:Lactoylglutathione lyase [Tulasnella sp. 403]